MIGWKMKFGCVVDIHYALAWLLLKGADYGSSIKWLKEVILFIYVSEIMEVLKCFVEKKDWKTGDDEYGVILNKMVT